MVEPYSKEVEEYTVEANPESLSLSKITLMKKYGVNRVSIGAESTDDKILKSINRKHKFDDVKKVVSNLRANGINNINLDLIIGLPNVSFKMLEKDIQNILSLKPNHISCYSLTVHEHTVFYINKIEEPDEEYAYNAYKTINDILENKISMGHARVLSKIEDEDKIKELANKVILAFVRETPQSISTYGTKTPSTLTCFS